MLYKINSLSLSINKSAIFILFDRGSRKNVIIYSTEGGMDIETVAEETPHLVHKEFIDPTLGLQSFQLRKIAFNLGLSGPAFKDMTKFLYSVYNCYIKSDASMIEINPLAIDDQDRVIALDAKMTIDENALFRQRATRTYDLFTATIRQIGSGKRHATRIAKAVGN